MNELDIFLTTQLINKSGIFDVKKFVEINEQMLKTKKPSFCVFRR